MEAKVNVIFSISLLVTFNKVKEKRIVYLPYIFLNESENLSLNFPYFINSHDCCTMQ